MKEGMTTMLTANQSNIQTAIRLEHSHMGIRVFLGETDEQLMGCIDVCPAWGVTDLSQLPKDVSLSDEVYCTDQGIYKRLVEAVVNVTAGYLTQTMRVDLPDYF
jgi:hypothetical protein